MLLEPFEEDFHLPAIEGLSISITIVLGNDASELVVIQKTTD